MFYNVVVKIAMALENGGLNLDDNEYWLLLKKKKENLHVLTNRGSLNMFYRITNNKKHG